MKNKNIKAPCAAQWPQRCTLHLFSASLSLHTSKNTAVQMWTNCTYARNMNNRKYALIANSLSFGDNSVYVWLGQRERGARLSCGVSQGVVVLCCHPTLMIRQSPPDGHREGEGSKTHTHIHTHTQVSEWTARNLHQKQKPCRAKERGAQSSMSLKWGMWLVWSADLSGAGAHCTALLSAARAISLAARTHAVSPGTWGGFIKLCK